MVVTSPPNAPDTVFPGQLEDAQTAYDWLLGRGIRPEHIAVAGDSAGGGLAVALLVALRDAGRIPAVRLVTG